MKNALKSVLTFILLASINLYSYSQCCPVKEKTGQRDQYLYESDVIQMDIYTAPQDEWMEFIDTNTKPQIWDYNIFIRLRAWSNRAENTDNYIQLYWWIGDGNDLSLVQKYANGVGPKAGTYELNIPRYGRHNFGSSTYIYYWTYFGTPTDQAILMSYRTHGYMLEETGNIWVCPYSSYASQGGDLSNNNTNYVMGTQATDYITHFNSLKVLVDTGDDGNIYVQIGCIDCGENPAVTIGRKTRQDIHHLSVTAQGEGIVKGNPVCEYYAEGDVITMIPVPNSESVTFYGWTGEHANYITDNGDGTYSIKMQSEDMRVTAVFESLQEVKGTYGIETTCADANELKSVFVREQGKPVSYDLIFSESAKSQGFVDIFGQSMAEAETVDISAPMPKKSDNPLWYVRPEQYAASLVVTDLYGRQTTYPTIFTVLYPSWVILQRWNDVLTITNRDFNGGYDFTHVQWYVDDQMVDGMGENNYYYYAGDSLKLQFGVPYRAVLTRADDGMMFSTCEYVPSYQEEKVIFKEDLKVAPRYAGNAREVDITTSLSGRYVVYDISGRVVMSGWFGTEYGDMDIVFNASFPTGTYLINFISDTQKEIHKKWIVY